MIIGGGIFLALYFIFGQSASDLLGTSMFVSAMGVPVALWRINTILTIINHGFAVSAMINAVSFFDGRGRVEYVYSFRGQKYQSGNAVFKSRFTRTLQTGKSVVVLIDGNNPKRAFIQELYTKSL